MKYAFYVSNQATTLKKIIRYLSKSIKFNKLIDQIEFVYIDTDTNSELRGLLNLLNIQLIEKDLSNIVKEEKNEIISMDLLNNLEKYNVDYLFVFGERLLTTTLISNYRNKIINFHPSLLPSFAGFKAIDKGIKYGSLILGNTAHFIDEGVDTGSIIMQNIFIAKNFIEYSDVIDKQIVMLVSIMIWINQDRLQLKGRNAMIKDAQYQIAEFIPNIEHNF